MHIDGKILDNHFLKSVWLIEANNYEIRLTHGIGHH
jgi:hypothetical protein